MMHNLKEKTCVDCGASFITKWGRKIRCDSCSASKRAKRASDSVKRNKQAISKAVAEIRQAAAADMTPVHAVYERPEMEWVVSYKVEFERASSKNARWSNTGDGVVYLTKAVRRYQDYLIHATKRALACKRVRQNKVWVSFLVQKPNHKSDAINVIDTLCDAIKKAIGIDDRWFCIGQLDWEINPTDPKIFISIGQASNEDVIVCSYCGSVKSLDQFPRKKSGPFGKDRVCLDCKKVVYQNARKKK